MDYKVADDMTLTGGINFQQLEVIRSEVWTWGTGYQTLVADTNYVTINFNTPAKGSVWLSPVDINKTGFELLCDLIEGGTYVATGSANVTEFNLNRNNVGTVPITPVKVGLSTAGTTIASGVSAPTELVPGVAGGFWMPGGIGGNRNIILKPSTMYTLKFTAKGGQVTMAANIDLTYEAPGS